MIHHSVELRISFEGGAGLTSSVSREGVRFATDVPLAVGQRLAGTMHAARVAGESATTLCYRARVAAVRPVPEPGVFEVDARFEQLAFAPPAIVPREADPPVGRTDLDPAVGPLVASG